MRRYNIAYFTADCNYELVESTLKGLRKYVEDHPQVSLRVFDCFGVSRDATRNISGYRIYDLPDLRDFDGLLIQGNQIIPEEIRKHISRKVLENRIPAISVDCPMEGCRLIGMDNRQAQMDITEHLIQHHGARKLVYLTGDMTNKSPNAAQRLEGFYQACGKYGINRKDTRVVQCAWQTEDGQRVGREWLKKKRKLPDAFVCANDEMAIGLTEVLSGTGIRIPEDVMVTGFDHIDSSELADPCLTTVDRDFGGVNYHAMDRLIRLIEGEEIPEKEVYPYRLVLAESCGCAGEQNLTRIKRQSFRRTRFLMSFNSQQDHLIEEMVRVSSLPELMEVFRQRSTVFGSDRVYLCINDFYFDRYGQKDGAAEAQAFGREMVMLRDENDSPSGSAFDRFPSREMLPESILDNNRFIIFYLLQSEFGSIGYLAVNGISEVTRLNLHQSLLSFLEISIENVQKKQLLNQLNDRLDQLYVHDKLTGLYNRFGLERYGEPLYRRLLAADGGAQLLFADIDEMKQINDQYGHEYGDEAIRAAAQILTDSAGEDSFLMRYGGDEFLMIAPLGDEDCAERIEAALELSGDLPFRLNISVGVRKVREDEGRTLYEWIRDADQLMYEVKRKRKAK